MNDSYVEQVSAYQARGIRTPEAGGINVARSLSCPGAQSSFDAVSRR